MSPGATAVSLCSWNRTDRRISGTTTLASRLLACGLGSKVCVYRPDCVLPVPGKSERTCLRKFSVLLRSLPWIVDSQEKDSVCMYVYVCMYKPI